MLAPPLIVGNDGLCLVSAPWCHGVVDWAPDQTSGGVSLNPIWHKIPFLTQDVGYNRVLSFLK